MDESIVKNFERKVGTLKLSEAIRIGLKTMKESRLSYFNNGCACAIGLAGAGYGLIGEYVPQPRLFDYVSNKSGLPLELLNEAEFKHLDGMPAEQIADWLESQGL